MKTRMVTLTIYSITADQLDTSTAAGTQYVNGRIRVSAHGSGEEHTWEWKRGRCWVGDTVTVMIVEDEPGDDKPPALLPVVLPIIDRRAR